MLPWQPPDGSQLLSRVQQPFRQFWEGAGDRLAGFQQPFRQAWLGSESDYDYPQRQTTMGKMGTTAARYSEWLLDRSHQVEYQELQDDMQYWQQVYGSAQTPEEEKGAQDGMKETQSKIDELTKRTQEGAGDVRAIPAIAEQPSLALQLGQVASQYPGDFGWQPPGTPGGGGYDVEVVQGAGRQPAAAQAPAADIDLTHAAPQPMAAKDQQLGIYAPPAPATTQAAKPLLPAANIPAGGYLGPPTGEFAANAGNYPADAYAARHGTTSSGTINAFTGPEEAGGAGGIPGIPSPGFRGFETYEDLRQGLRAGGRPLRNEPGLGAYQRANLGVFEPWQIQSGMGGQFSQADSLQQMLGNYRGRSYRGRTTQTIDMGQGIQDYDVRRDAYGNIRSYMPAAPKNQPWNPYTSRYD